MKTVMCEMKNTLDEINFWLDTAEKEICKFEKFSNRNHPKQEKREWYDDDVKKKKSISELWERLKWPNVHVIGIQEEERGRGRKY